MLNRRHLRIKVLQGLYAFLCSHDDDIAKGEKELLKSINSTKELFVWQISLMFEMRDFAFRRIEESKLKFYPTDEDLNPNTRFINNRFIQQLEDNKDINNLITKYHVSWIENEEAIRRLFLSVRDSEGYTSYIRSENNYENDKNFVIDIYTNFIFVDEFLLDLYETKNIFWYSDFYIIQYQLVKFFDNYKEEFSCEVKLPDVIKSSNDDAQEDDMKFVDNLFRKTILEKVHYDELIKSKIHNWDMDRVSFMDILILDMALSELVNFSNIPVKVTLNEYIELSKIFSSSKSKYFINGILDSIIEELKKSGEIVKVGRGLLE